MRTAPRVRTDATPARSVQNRRPYPLHSNGSPGRSKTILHGMTVLAPCGITVADAAAIVLVVHHYNHHRPYTAIGTVPPISRLTNLPGQYS